jgi:hypothetical protein
MGSAVIAYLKKSNAPEKLRLPFSIFPSFNGQVASLGSLITAIFNYSTASSLFPRTNNALPNYPCSSPLKQFLSTATAYLKFSTDCLYSLFWNNYEAFFSISEVLVVGKISTTEGVSLVMTIF